MAHNSDVEDPNDINNDSLEFNSEDDNFDEYLDDECKPTPMDDIPPLNHQSNNIHYVKQSNNNNSIQNNNRMAPPRFHNEYNAGNTNTTSYFETIPPRNNNNFNSTESTNIPLKSSGGGLKLLNRGLINKSSQNTNQDNNNVKLVSNNNENSSTNIFNKSEISFPPLPSQNSINAQQQKVSNIPLRASPRLLQSVNSKDNNVNNNQSIPGIPIIESSSGNFNSSLQNSLFTKNEDGSTVINFPPLKGENDKKNEQISSIASQNLLSQKGERKLINFPPLKGEESDNKQQNMRYQVNEQQKELHQSSLQLPSNSNIDQSQLQQPSQIRVSIKPKFLLKQQQASKQQVPHNLDQQQSQQQNLQQQSQSLLNQHPQPSLQQPQQNLLLNLHQNLQQQQPNLQQSQQSTQQQSHLQMPQQNILPNQQQQNQIQNPRQVIQNQPQNVQQLQNQFQNAQQQQFNQIQSNQIPIQNPQQQQQATVSNFNQPQQPLNPIIQQAQKDYILTPTDRVVISFDNKLNLSLAALRRSIANELSSSLRLPYCPMAMTATNGSSNQEISKTSLTSERYSYAGRLPSSFDSDVDTFLDNLNSELLEAVSFSPLIGIGETSFSSFPYNNANTNNFSQTTSVNNTEVMNVSNANEINNNNIMTGVGVGIGSEQNKYNSLNYSNMSFAAERCLSALVQNINSAIDENIKPITGNLAASSIVDKQMCDEQVKSLQRLKKEVASLRSLFKSSVNTIFENLNQKVSQIESNEQFEAKKRKRNNRFLNEMRFKKRDLQMQMEKQASEKEKNEIAFRNLLEKRNKIYTENYTKNGADMKLNKLIKIIENLEKEIKDEVATFYSSKSSRYVSSNDLITSSLADSLDYGERIMQIDEESMRNELMETAASNRWIANNFYAIAKSIEKENILNASFGNRSQLQLKYSPERKGPIAMNSPRRENKQTSFL